MRADVTTPTILDMARSPYPWSRSLFVAYKPTGNIVKAVPKAIRIPMEPTKMWVEYFLKLIRLAWMMNSITQLKANAPCTYTTSGAENLPAINGWIKVLPKPVRTARRPIIDIAKKYEGNVFFKIFM